MWDDVEFTCGGFSIGDNKGGGGGIIEWEDVEFTCGGFCLGGNGPSLSLLVSSSLIVSFSFRPRKRYFC